FVAAKLLCSEDAFTSVDTLDTATGLAITGITGTCSQLRRPEPPARIALERPLGFSNPATRIGLASLLVPTTRTPLVTTGDLLLLLAGFVVATIAGDAGADWLFEPGPVTEVRVSTTLLPV